MKRVLAVVLFVLFTGSLAWATKLIANGATSQSISVVIKDATGAPATGVTITDLDMYVVVDGHEMSAKTDIAALASDHAAWNDYSGYELGLGLYRIDIPDANLDDGAGKTVTFIIDDAVGTNQTVFYEVQLAPPINLDDATGDLDDSQIDDLAMGTPIDANDFFARIEAIVPTDFNSCTVDGNDALVTTVGFFSDNGLDYFSSAGTLVSSIWSAVARTLTAPTNITSDDSEILASSGALTIGTNNDKTGYTLSVAGLASVTGGILADPTHPVYTDASGYVGVGTMSTDVLTADALADAAATEIGSGVSASLGDGSAFTALATASDQTAIKAKTDQLAFTDPNRVDASATVETSSINTIVAAIKKYLWKQ